MKIPYAFSTLIAAAMVSANVAGAAIYATDFESFTVGDIVGQDGWTSNSSTPDVGAIIDTGNPSVWGDRTASIGFVAPVSRPDLYVSRNIPAVTLTSSGFSVLFQVVDSDSTFGLGAEIRDTFGFRLENAAGDNLFSFFLTPFDQDPEPENDTAFHIYSWSTGADAPINVLDSPLVSSEEDFAYTLKVSFFDAGPADAGFLADINGDTFTGILPGLGSESIERMGALWILNDDTNFNPGGIGEYYGGSNFLLFDNMTVIPEPSTTLPLALLLAGGIMFRSRTKRA